MPKQRKRKKLIVDRSKWRSGGDGSPRGNASGRGVTRLLNNEGYMCCLGFACKQFGNVEDKHILYIGEPKRVFSMYGKPVEKLTKIDSFGWERNTSLSTQAMAINDDSLLTREEREKSLKALFSKFHVDLSFVGDYE